MISSKTAKKLSKSMASLTPRTPNVARLSSSTASSSLNQAVNEDGAKSNSTSRCPVQPILKQVPSLPFFGSLIQAHSGLQKMGLQKQYESSKMYRRQFSDFFSYGVPGFGTGLHGTMYTIYDPNEMVKVVRSKGDRPSGLVEKIWAWKRAMKATGFSIISEKETVGEDGEKFDYGLFDRGDGWKRQRTFLQTGMLDPNAARGFIPGIVEAAERASKVAPAHANDFNEYLNYTAFDMFCSFMFGTQMRTTETVISNDPDERAQNAENERFVNAALGAFHATNKLTRTPSEYLMAKFLPFFKTGLYSEVENNIAIVREVGHKKIYEFIERYDRDELDEMERASYLAGAIERQRVTNELTQEEMVDLCLTALFVGVDTTSSVTAWNLMHLAINLEVQEKLHKEVGAAVAAVGAEGGTKVNAEVLGRKVTPNLHMCIRESHRATPAFAAAMWKGNSKTDVEVHGHTIPKGSVVQLCHVSYDPEFVPDAKVFRPERWEAEEVDERKNTTSEVLDHPLLRDPFSQGARRCPGSRVATNEIFAMVAQIVLDWKFSVPDSIKSLDDVQYDASPIKPIFPLLKFQPRD